MELSKLLVLLLSRFSILIFFSRHFYKITFVGNIEVMNCTIFGIVVNSTFCKKKKMPKTIVNF